jgi:hypothetical protein
MTSCRALVLLAAVLCAPLACSFSDDSCRDQSGFRCAMIPEDSSGSADEGSSGEDACMADSPAAILRVENRTGNAIEIIQFVRCDHTDASEFPLMPPGLADGDDVEVPLPGPGCWLLDYSGDGCQGETPHETEMQVCAGETYVWTPDAAHQVCAG